MPTAMIWLYSRLKLKPNSEPKVEHISSPRLITKQFPMLAAVFSIMDSLALLLILDNFSRNHYKLYSL